MALVAVALEMVLVDLAEDSEVHLILPRHRQLVLEIVASEVALVETLVSEIMDLDLEVDSDKSQIRSRTV